MSLARMSLNRRTGFSLVEVVRAIGLVAFATVRTPFRSLLNWNCEIKERRGITATLGSINWRRSPFQGRRKTRSFSISRTPVPCLPNPVLERLRPKCQPQP